MSQNKKYDITIEMNVYGPTQNPDGTWRIKTNDELKHRTKQEDIIKFIKSQRMRWAAHVREWRIQELPEK